MNLGYILHACFLETNYPKQSKTFVSGVFEYYAVKILDILPNFDKEMLLPWKQ